MTTQPATSIASLTTTASTHRRPSAPRRRAVGIVGLTALALLAAVTTPLLADTKVNERRAGSADGTVEIANIAGSIEVRGTSGSEIVIEGTLHPDIERLDITQNGRTTRIEVIYPQRRGSNHGKADLVISVPAGNRITTETVSASQRVSGITGELRLESVSGELAVTGKPERAELASVSGNIEADLETSRVRAETVSGGSTLRGRVRDAEVTTVSGSSEVRIDGAERVTIEAVSGTVRWQGTLAARGVLRAESFSGTVDVTLGTGNATVNASSFSGSIDNGLGDGKVDRAEHGPGSDLDVTLGNGDARFEVESFSGSVKLRR